MFSQRRTAGKHMVSFPCVVAACAPDRAWNYKDCKRRRRRHERRRTAWKTLTAWRQPLHLLPLFWFTQPLGSQKDSLHLERGLREAFHACVSTESCTLASVLSQYFTDFMLSISALFGRVKGKARREKRNNTKGGKKTFLGCVCCTGGHT